MAGRGKQRIKILCVFAVAALCAATFCGCFWQYKLTQTERFAVGYRKKDAFVAAWFWNGDREDMTVNVPEEYEGRKITALGGYSGKGYPCPFFVEDTSVDYDWTSDIAWGDEDYETLVFTVVIGKYVKKIYAKGKMYYGNDRPNDDGTTTNDTRIKVAYRFEVSPENKTFYTQDGKLYRKKDAALIDEFFYE